ncbi:MAG: hypothetical protein CL933_16610 [Deltaproteobacteria bacterium]|nr:hypothetical protein [Deltaproteobacteria bacterium]
MEQPATEVTLQLEIEIQAEQIQGDRGADSLARIQAHPLVDRSVDALQIRFAFVFGGDRPSCAMDDRHSIRRVDRIDGPHVLVEERAASGARHRLTLDSTPSRSRT